MIIAVKKQIKCPVCAARLCDAKNNKSVHVTPPKVPPDVGIFIKCRKCNKEVTITF